MSFLEEIWNGRTESAPGFKAGLPLEYEQDLFDIILFQQPEPGLDENRELKSYCDNVSLFPADTRFKKDIAPAELLKSVPEKVSDEKGKLNLDGTVLIRDVLRYIDSDRYLGKTDAAYYLGLSRRNIESRLTEIPHFRVGGKLLFKKSLLDIWMQQHSERPEELDLRSQMDALYASLTRNEED